jgi:hypothetical protein
MTALLATGARDRCGSGVLGLRQAQPFPALLMTSDRL